MELSQKYPDLLKHCKPYAFTHESNMAFFDQSSFKDLTHYCPTKNESKSFFDLIKKVDSLSFGETGLEMESWVLLDCAIMPGGVFGFGIEEEKLPIELKQKMQIPNDYKGLVPISLFIAIPMANKTHWFGHNLCSLNKYLSQKISGLGVMTKYYGIQFFKIEKMMGATQWNNNAIFVHAKLARMKLHSAITEVHSYRESLLYESDYSHILKSKEEEVLQNASKEKLNKKSVEDIQSLDSKIKQGNLYYIESQDYCASHTLTLTKIS